MHTALQPVFVAAYAVTLFAVGVWHVVAGEMTERLFSQTRFVRPVGALLILAALPCFLWRGVYFDVMGAILLASGVLRWFTPGWNVQLQKRTYPRWVHGWVMITSGVLSWVLFRWLVR